MRKCTCKTCARRLHSAARIALWWDHNRLGRRSLHGAPLLRLPRPRLASATSPPIRYACSLRAHALVGRVLSLPACSLRAHAYLADLFTALRCALCRHVHSAYMSPSGIVASDLPYLSRTEGSDILLLTPTASSASDVRSGRPSPTKPTHRRLLTWRTCPRQPRVHNGHLFTTAFCAQCGHVDYVSMFTADGGGRLRRPKHLQTASLAVANRRRIRSPQASRRRNARSRRRERHTGRKSVRASRTSPTCGHCSHVHPVNARASRLERYERYGGWAELALGR